MRIVILENVQQVNARAADIICSVVQSIDNPVLGLATGGTPVGTYQELIARHVNGAVSFAHCTTFNLDEYVGLPVEHAQSYRSFMQQHLFNHIDVPADKTHLPCGTAQDFVQASEQYEEQIDAAGGIDLQLLGIGTDGHIAFNEPGSSLASRTRVKALTEQTRRDNARFFDSPEQVPKLALTMGIETILEAEQILLIATGAGKAAAVRAFVEGPISAQVPASALQLHPRVTVLLDREAAASLERRPYYEHVEAIQLQIESGTFL